MDGTSPAPADLHLLSVMPMDAATLRQRRAATCVGSIFQPWRMGKRKRGSVLPKSPIFRDRGALEGFRQPATRTRRGHLRKVVHGEKPALRDFMVGDLGGVLAEILDQEEGHVVAGAGVPVEMQRAQERGGDKLDIALFGKLASQRLEGRFALLDAAARQMPAGYVCVADQEDFMLATVMDDGADPECHRPRQEKIAMEELGPEATPARLAEHVLFHMRHASAKGWCEATAWRMGL